MYKILGALLVLIALVVVLGFISGIAGYQLGAWWELIDLFVVLVCGIGGVWLVRGDSVR